MALDTVASPWLWIGFTGFVLAMLALDLGVFHRKAHSVGMREAALWSAVWVSLAAVFNLGVYAWFGSERALEFTAGYLIEKALAVDNIFVFVLLFSTFAVPEKHQHRVLFWGVLGALVMRAAFIFAGSALIHRFDWIIYVFGALLALTGVKLLVRRGKESDPAQNPLVRALRRVLPVAGDASSGRFFLAERGRWFVTPLFLALVALELTDLVFAIDSIPAVFGVTTDPFIVFTSNVFAILGLRSLYFLLAGVITRFVYLKTGLALVLVFVGAKMLLAKVYHVPIGISLGVIAAILAVSILVSWLRPPREKQEAPAADQPGGPARRQEAQA
jgi:tellurite resistance protein TerC